MEKTFKWEGLLAHLSRSQLTVQSPPTIIRTISEPPAEKPKKSYCGARAAALYSLAAVDVVLRRTHCVFI
jgi:hypothetical protein